MKPLLRPRLVNDRFADPGLYLDFRFRRRALLFDLGDLHALAPRELLAVTGAFVSHCHMDHFAGFDRLLRLFLAREATVDLFGPAGFLDRLEHKLAGYSWNLVGGFPTDLTFRAGELSADGRLARADFRVRAAFAREDRGAHPAPGGVLMDEAGLTVRAAVLDHGIPVLGFAAEETRAVNVLKDRLQALGLRVGPWLQDLKRAVLRDAPDETPIRAWWREGGALVERHEPLGRLKARALRVTPGQRLAYVTDVRYHDDNVARIVDLARGADVLFIETPFLEEDADIAARKNHLTAAQAGRIARLAGVRRLEPFHFSPRYQGREDELVAEALAAFAG